MNEQKMEYRVSYSFSKTKLKENFFMTVMLMLSYAVRHAFQLVDVCVCFIFIFIFTSHFHCYFFDLAH